MATPTVRAYGPQVDVRVFPYDGSPELTVHGDFIDVSTSKTIGEPAGMFSVRLIARRDPAGRTWAHRIGPMDYLEIFMQRDSKNKGTRPPVMRCFVDNSYEDDAVTEGGQVQRAVIINGRDAGKVLLNKALVFAAEADPLSMLNPEYTVGIKLGPGGLDAFVGLMTPIDFLGRVRDYLLKDPTVGAQFRNSRVPPIRSFTDIPDTHKIGPAIHLSPITGSIWQFLQDWTGKPFNELFIRDDLDGPRIYWRMAPLHDKTGAVATHGDFMPTQKVTSISPAQNFPTTTISLEDVIKANVGRSDNEAFCYYFTYSNLFNLSDAEAAFIYPPGLPTVSFDPFGASQTGPVGLYAGNPMLRRDTFLRYGFKPLKVNYPLMPFPTQADKDATSDMSLSMVQESVKLTTWMHAVFSPNPALESGTLILKGNPDIVPGSYVRIKEQNREFYVEGVHHSFTVFPQVSFQTTVDVTRGNWLTNSPYPELRWL